MQRFFRGLSFRTQDVKIVRALYVSVLVNGRIARVGHANLFALIDVGRAAHHVDERRQHLGGLFPVVPIVAEAGYGAGLVVIAPEQRVPGAARLHAFLPLAQKVPQGLKIGIHERPFLAALVVHLEVVEREHHLEFFLRRICVAQAVVEGCGRHLSHGHHVGNAGVSDKLFQVLMDPGAVRIESSAVSDEVVFQYIRLGDQVDHVEAEASDALLLPEADDILELFSHLRVLPVEVCLGDIEQMQVIFFQGRHIFPRVAAELGNPVCGSVSVHGIPENIVIHVLGIARQRLLKPLVLGGRVVEDHVKHQADAALVRLADQSLRILHGSEHGIDRIVVRHIVAVVVHRRFEERSDPDIVDSQGLQVVQAGADPVQITDPVSVGITV